MEPLTVSFDIVKDDVWVDPDGVAWYVEFTEGDHVHMWRKVVVQVTPLDLVRKWRRVGA